MTVTDLGGRLNVGIAAVRHLIEEQVETVVTHGGVHIVAPLRERLAAPLARIGATVEGLPVTPGNCPIRFRVAVIGRFSTGKSTLLSSISGRALAVNGIPGGLLPESASPCTAIPTLLMSGPGPLEIHLVGRPGHHRGAMGLRQLIDVATLKAMHLHPVNTPDEDPFPDVDRIEITGALPQSFDNVVLIDTLGADDRPGHTARTLEIAQTADAIVVLFRGAMGAFATPDELAFLAKAAPPRAAGAKKVFFVINQDRLRPFDEAGVAYLWDLILAESSRASPHAGEPLEAGDIFLVNAMAAKLGRLEGDDAKVTSSGLPALEARLADFLITDGLTAKIAPVIGDLVEVSRVVENGVRADILRMRKRRIAAGQTTETVSAPLARLIATLENLKAQTKRTAESIRDQIHSSFRAAMMSSVGDVQGALEDHTIAATTGWLKKMRHLVLKKAAIEEVQGVLRDAVQARMSTWASEVTEITSPVRIFEGEQTALIEIIARRFAEIDIALDKAKRELLGDETATAAETLKTRVSAWRAKLEVALRESVASQVEGMDFSGEYLSAAFGASVMFGLAQVGIIPVVQGTVLKLGIWMGMQTIATGIASVVAWPVGLAAAIGGALFMNRGTDQKLKTKALEEFNAKMEVATARSWAAFEQNLSTTIEAARDKFDRQINDVGAGARAELEVLLTEAQASVDELDELIARREADSAMVAGAIRGLQALLPAEEHLDVAAE